MTLTPLTLLTALTLWTPLTLPLLTALTPPLKMLRQERWRIDTRVSIEAIMLDGDALAGGKKVGESSLAERLILVQTI